MYYVGILSAAFVRAEEASRCFSVNSESYCFYTNGSVLSWDQAIEFCDSKNATLPIISDGEIDNVFKQFIVGDAKSVIGDKSFWIAAHSQLVNNNSRWHWVDGTPSGATNV